MSELASGTVTFGSNYSDDVPKAAGFTEVGKAGDYTLYRLDACR